MSVNPVDIVRFRGEHFNPSEIRAYSQDVACQITWAYLSTLEHVGPGYTLFVDGESVAAIVFARLMYSGVAEVLMLSTDRVEQHKRILFRICRRCADDVQQTHGFHRLETRIPANYEIGRRWAERFGFESEGIVRAFGALGEDYVLYSKVRKDLICRHY